MEGLTALGETTEMAGHASFFKADRLAALGAGLSQKAVRVLARGGLLVLQVSRLEDPADGIGNREHQSIL